ncbi:MFS transporter [Enterobacterales bacterium CwR94]|nr:MFS transporter [Enterobacterales bacterium CwR94]
MPFSFTPRERGITFTVCLAALILPLSFTAGVTALPAIAQALPGSPLLLNGVTNGFMLLFGSLLLAAGSLADHFGRKRLFMAGLILFFISALACLLVPTLLWLNIARAVQGCAAAAVLAGGSASLASALAEPQRLRAFALLGSCFGIGLALGPLLSGSLLDTLGWRGIFLLIALLALVAAITGRRFLPESRHPAPGAVDYPGMLLFCSLLGTLIPAVMLAGQQGWQSPWVILLLACSAALTVGFIWRERRAASPLFALALLRHRRFLGVQLLPIATCCSFVMLLVLMPLRLMRIDGYSPLQAALLLLALSAPLLVVPTIAVKLNQRVSAASLCAAGLLIATLGLVGLSFVNPHVSPLATLAALAVIGTGSALPWGLMDNLSVSVVPRDHAGMAVGIFSTVRVASEGVMLAIVMTLLSGLMHLHLPLSSAAMALATGDLQLAQRQLPAFSEATLITIYQQAFQILLWILSAVTLLAAVITARWLQEKPQPSAALTCS